MSSIFNHDALAAMIREAVQQALPAPVQESAWTVEECAAFLKVSRDTVYDLAGAGKIPCVKIGKLYRFDPSAVRAWLANSKQKNN